MKTTLETVRCARLPTSGLAALAGLRRGEGISVLVDGDHSWAFWETSDDRILRALFPIAGVELFERQGSAWHRWGRRIPCFEVPDAEHATAIAGVIFPSPFEILEPDEASPRLATFRLVREGRQRPSSAALCSLAELGRWAESAPSRAIESVRGAIQGDQALVIGRGLPSWPGSVRYWGERVLVPIGFEVRPNLPEAAILEALGGPGLEVFRFFESENDGEGTVVEAIPFDSFRPLTRAGIRIALRARIS